MSARRDCRETGAMFPMRVERPRARPRQRDSRPERCGVVSQARQVMVMIGGVIGVVRLRIVCVAMMRM